jgi:hypothetical protein
MSRVLLGAAVSIAGVALLVWQVRQTGADAILASLAQVGWGFLVILALSLIRFALRSAAWMSLMGGGVPFSGALGATMAGDAIGNVTPLSLLVSEPAKSLYLRDRVPGSRSFPALTAENFFYSVSVAIVIIIGTIAMLVAFAVPPDLQGAGLAALALMAAILAGALWVVLRRPAILSPIMDRLPLPLARRLAHRVREFEATTYAVVGRRRGALALTLACEAAFHLVSFVEAYYTLWLITGRSAPLAAFVLDTVNRIIGVVFRMMPFRIGVDEATTALVAPAVGFSPAVGVTIALVRKGRLLVWAGVGIALAIRKGLRVSDLTNRTTRSGV